MPRFTPEELQRGLMYRTAMAAAQRAAREVDVGSEAMQCAAVVGTIGEVLERDARLESRQALVARRQLFQCAVQREHPQVAIAAETSTASMRSRLALRAAWSASCSTSACFAIGVDSPVSGASCDLRLTPWTSRPSAASRSRGVRREATTPRTTSQSSGSPRARSCSTRAGPRRASSSLRPTPTRWPCPPRVPGSTPRCWPAKWAGG